MLTADHGIGAVLSETSYGVDAFGGGAPADSAVLAFSTLEIVQVIEQIEGDRLTATIAGECHANHLSHTDVNWSAKLTGSSAPGEIPAADPILRSCGFQRTVTADTSVVYSPITENDQTNTPSATWLGYERSIEDGLARRLMSRGARGNFTLDWTVGQEAMINGAAQGLYDAYPDTASALPDLPEMYGEDQCGWIVNALTLTSGGVALPVESMTFSTNWTLEVIRAGAALGGGTASKILLTKPKSGSRMGGEFSLVDGAAALTKVIQDWKNGAKFQLTGTIVKGSRSISLDLPAAQLGSPTKALPRFGVPYFAVRADGATGQGHVLLTYA